MDLNADEHAQDYDRNKAVCDLALASLIAAGSCSIRTMPPLGATEWDEWLQAWDEAAKKLHRRALALNPGVKVQRTYRLFLQVRGDAAEIQRICGADAADYLYQQASRLRNEALAAVRKSTADKHLREAARLDMAASMVEAEPAVQPYAKTESADEYDQVRKFAEEEWIKYGTSAADHLRQQASHLRDEARANEPEPTPATEAERVAFLELTDAERAAYFEEAIKQEPAPLTDWQRASDRLRESANRLELAARILEAEAAVRPGTKMIESANEYEQVRQFAQDKRTKYGARAAGYLRREASRLRDEESFYDEVEWRQGARLHLAAAMLDAAAAPLTDAERAANWAGDIDAYGGGPAAYAETLGLAEAYVAAGRMDAEAGAVCDRTLAALAPVLHRRRPSRRELAEAWAEAAEALDLHYLAPARRWHLRRLRRTSLLDRRFTANLQNTILIRHDDLAVILRVQARSASTEADRPGRTRAHVYDLRRHAERADRAARMLEGLCNDLKLWHRGTPGLRGTPGARLRLSVLDRWSVAGTLRAEGEQAALAALASAGPGLAEADALDGHDDGVHQLSKEAMALAWAEVAAPSIERLLAAADALRTCPDVQGRTRAWDWLCNAFSSNWYMRVGTWHTKVEAMWRWAEAECQARRLARTNSKARRQTLFHDPTAAPPPWEAMRRSR